MQLAVNAKATHDFELLEKFEGGLVLTGAEVKSAKNGNITLKGSFLTIQRGGLVLKHAHIGKYASAGPQPDYDPRRDRAVLVHKRELNKIKGKHEADRLTIVPLSMYISHGLVKLGFALARGKKMFEKRETIKKRDLDREVRARLKE